MVTLSALEPRRGPTSSESLPAGIATLKLSVQPFSLGGLVQTAWSGTVWPGGGRGFFGSVGGCEEGVRRGGSGEWRLVRVGVVFEGERGGSLLTFAGAHSNWHDSLPTQHSVARVFMGIVREARAAFGQWFNLPS
jgi:hypothetical protein